MRKIGFLAVVALLLLLAALAVPVAAATEKQITELPYSDEGTTETYGYYENTFYYTGSSSYAHSNLALTLSQVQNFPHIYYATLEISSDYSPAPEGYTNAWYIRPSDGTYQKCVVQIVKTRNVLNQVTKTLISFYPTNWEVGSVTGAYTTSIYYDNNGVPSATGFLDVQGTKCIYGITKADGNDDYEGRLYFAGRINYASSMRSHVEGYGSTYYRLDVSKAYSSVTIALTRTKDGVSYPSSLNISDSSGSVIISDSTSVDKSFTIAESRFSSASVSIGEDITKYLYNTGGSTEPAESDYFSLSLSGDSASVGDPVTATLTPAADAPRYSEIAWTISDPSGNVDVEIYQKSSSDWTTWTHYNKTAFQFEPTAADPHILTFTPTSADTWTVRAVVRDIEPPASGAALADLSKSCEVERAAGNVDVVVSVFDGAKSSASYLAGVGVVVRDLTRDTVIYDSTGEYILGASGTTNGRVTFSAPLGDQIQITAKKTGYLTATITNFVQPTALPLNQMPISITLMPAATPAPDKAYLTVLVTDLRSQPIEGASVLVAGSGGVTGSQGTCRITVPTNQTLSYTVSAQGYHSVSGYVMDGITENTQITVALYSSAPVTPTVTHTPGGTTGPGGKDHHAMVDQTLEDAYDVVPSIFGFALLMLFFAIVRRGGR